MAEKEISVNELVPGMYVARVVGDSTSAALMVSGLRIKNQADIERIKKAKIERVVIDPDKARASRVKAQDPDVPAVPLSQEMNAAMALRDSAKKAASAFMENALKDQPVEAAALTPVVHETLDSIGRNDQALLTIMHIKRHGEALLSHAISVMSLVSALGNRMELPREQIEWLGMAAMMHDVGWVRLPNKLFTHRRPYSASEKKLVERHPDFGLDILKKGSDVPEEVLQIVSQHHELLDGSGYPAQLKGDQIGLLSRLLALVDLYDSMVHGVMEFQGMTPNAALKFIYGAAQSGRLDNELVAPLVQMLGVYPLTSAVSLDSGEKAIVAELNRKEPIRPVVKIMYDAKGTPLANPELINLAEQSGKDSRSIKEIIDPSKPGVDPAKILVLQDGALV